MRALASTLKQAKLAAFGATRRATAAARRCQPARFSESGAPVWTLVGKSDPWQVTTVLQTTPSGNLAMVEESVAYGVGLGRELIFDAEHFFDGFAEIRSTRSRSASPPLARAPRRSSCATPTEAACRPRSAAAWKLCVARSRT